MKESEMKRSLWDYYEPTIQADHRPVSSAIASAGTKVCITPMFHALGAAYVCGELDIDNATVTPDVDFARKKMPYSNTEATVTGIGSRCSACHGRAAYAEQYGGLRLNMRHGWLCRRCDAEIAAAEDWHYHIMDGKRMVAVMRGRFSDVLVARNRHYAGCAIVDHYTEVHGPDLVASLMRGQ